MWMKASKTSHCSSSREQNCKKKTKIILMNKELWGKTTDLPSHFVTHFSTPWKEKKHSANSQDASFNQRSRAWICTQSRTPSPLSISLSSPTFFFILISARSRSVAFSPLYIYSILHLRRVSSFLLSFLLSPLSHSRAEGWARGSRYTKARHTHTHIKTQLAHKSSTGGGMQRASYNWDPLIRR